MADTKTHEFKTVTKDELAKMGLKVTRSRKPVTMTGDAKKDGKALAKRYFAECRKAYRRLESLANGKVTRSKKEYAITISKEQTDYMENQLVALHDAVFSALRTGVKVADVADFPD